jgi:hypothetical protein
LGTHYIIAGLESLGLGKGCILKNFEIEDESFHFLAWLVRQDVTLPSIMSDYLKWNHYTKQEIKNHLLALNMACIEAQKDSTDFR